MTKISGKEFTHGFLRLVSPEIQGYCKDLLKWSRGAAQEVLNLQKLLTKARAKLMTQEQLHKVEELEREKVEWEEEKKRLANDVILERNIVTKVVAQATELKNTMEQDRVTLCRQARQLLESESQVLEANNLVLWKESEIQTLTLEVMNLKEAYQTLESDTVHAEQERDEAQFEASTANDKEAQLTKRIQVLERQID
ncbi:unnamed protein product [Calypogeia fissa]